MSRRAPTLTKGAFYSFEVIEIINSIDILVSFEGELYRVKNLSLKKIQPGQRIQLQVKNTNPLELQWGKMQLNKLDRVI